MLFTPAQQGGRQVVMAHSVFQNRGGVAETAEQEINRLEAWSASRGPPRTVQVVRATGGYHGKMQVGSKRAQRMLGAFC